jgi:hypothetical protein
VYAFDALGAVPPSSAAAAAAAGMPLQAKPSVTSDLRWRASFAVQLYSALEVHTFRSLEPWLFCTSLRTLQPLVTRFWREDRLDLMEGVLRAVAARSASTGRVVAALAGWRSHSLDCDISDVQVQATVDEFRRRLIEAPQLQQAYRQQRRQQRQLTAVETHTSAGCSPFADNKQNGPNDSSSSRVECEASPAAPAPNPPALDLFSLSSSSRFAAFQTGELLVAPPPHWTSCAAAATAAATLEDAASVASSLALQASQRDAAALVALAAAGSADGSGPCSTRPPTPSHRDHAHRRRQCLQNSKRLPRTATC